MTPRVVIAHDFTELYGGAERFTGELARVFPDAPVVSILGRPEVARRMGVEDRISYLLPSREPLLRHYRSLAPLYFGIVRAARLPPADLLISSNYAYAQGFRPPPGARHLCYTWGPFRHLWSQQDQYEAALPFDRVSRPLFEAYVRAARALDLRATRSVDRFLTSSPYTAEQVRRFYGRSATVLAPPIDCRRFRPGDAPHSDHFLFVGRLVEPYKRPTLVVEAFNRMPDLRLRVAGDGPERKRLEAIAGPNVEFLGHLDDDRLVPEMQTCAAALFPSTDDYGLAPLEVNACGRPVIALAAGGAVHTVVAGRTGALLAGQSVDAVVEAVRRFRPEDYHPRAIRAHAVQWDREAFDAALRRLADQVLSDAAEMRTIRPHPEAGIAAMGAKEPL